MEDEYFMEDLLNFENASVGDTVFDVDYKNGIIIGKYYSPPKIIAKFEYDKIIHYTFEGKERYSKKKVLYKSEQIMKDYMAQKKGRN